MKLKILMMVVVAMTMFFSSCHYRENVLQRSMETWRDGRVTSAKSTWISPEEVAERYIVDEAFSFMGLAMSAAAYEAELVGYPSDFKDLQFLLVDGIPELFGI